MNFLKKIQQRPEKERKLILWITITIIGAMLLYLWWVLFKREVKEVLNGNTFEKIKFPSINLEEEYQERKVSFPFSEEEMKKIYEILTTDTPNKEDFLESSLGTDTENTSKNIKNEENK